MSSLLHEETDASIILAAEEFPPEKFLEFHSFSEQDNITIGKLIAHGPVLIRGGRGSGKSALLLEAHRRMAQLSNVFPVYMSLRYLPLLQSDGNEYIGHFCVLLSNAIQVEISNQNIKYDFGTASDQTSVQIGLNRFSNEIGKRVVLLFDDPAHIGREKPLEVFFDLFRTLSSGLTSCKAAIYPGVTRFGVRFDVYNDSTVIDITRSDISANRNYFGDVIKARYPKLATPETFSDRLSPTQFANLLGRAVVGNMRGFILACNRFEGKNKIGIPDINQCFLNMNTDYYWPLMDEVAPKLGIYEPLLEPARDLIEAVVDHSCRPVREKQKAIAQDRVLIHRNIVGQYSKILEILEYLGFISKREASRAMKSGGRGPVFAINLCNILEVIPSKRLTIEMIDEWISGSVEPSEIHISSNVFQNIKLPPLPEEHGLSILDKDVEVLAKSSAYPYGLTEDKIYRLKNEGIKTVCDLAKATDQELDAIEGIGKATIKRMRNVVFQAVWM